MEAEAAAGTGPRRNRFRVEVSPDEVIGFGKHKGSTFADIVRDDLGYARWCATVPEASLPLRRLVKYAENQGVIATTNAAAAAAAATARVTAAVAAAAAEGTPVLRRAAPPLARPCQKQAFVDDEPQTGNADCAAFAGYTGSLELELLGAAGFALRPDSRLPSEAWAALCSWPGCTWDRREKCFRFPSGQYKEVCQRLRALDAKAPCQIFFPPSWLLVAMKPFQAFGAVSVPKKTAQALSATPSRPCATLPVLQGREGHALLPYQKEGVEHGLAHGGRILLADEMGLGKTAQALMLASQYPADWPLLVICPSSLRGVWRDEAARWVPAGVVEEPENQIQVIRKGSEQPRPDARLIIVSYDLAAVNVHLCQTAGGENYRFVVCDECHYLKSPTSRRSLSLCPLLKSARRCVLLSGTPATGAAAELYTPLDALLPGLLPTYQEFCSRYCEEQSIHAGRKVLTRFVGSKKRAELNALLEGSVMLRRRKSAVLSQLPAKRRQRVLLEELDAKKMKELKEKVKDGSANATALDGDGGGGHGSLPELFLLTGLAKLKAVQEYVTTLLQAECRFLLFAHHTEVMDGLQNTLEQQKVDFIRIDGRTSARRREVLVADFQMDSRKRVALLSITACGTGLNLQCCSTVVFAELHWTPGTLFQAEDRVHRMGQTSCANIHYLIAQGTLDESMYKILDQKQQDMSTVLDGKTSTVGACKVEGRVGRFSKEVSQPQERRPDDAAQASEGQENEGDKKRKPTVQTLEHLWSKHQRTT